VAGAGGHSGLLGCDAVLLGLWWTAARRDMPEKLTVANGFQRCVMFRAKKLSPAVLSFLHRSNKK
jgi:hypothetical protein